MGTKLTLDKAGRLVIPKGLREDLELGPGDTLEVECEADRIILRPLRSRPPLEKERGVWVYRTGEPLTASQAQDTLRLVRDKRSKRSVAGVT
jgi:AbrB family looped-hinge helix DNA binding protein